MNIIKDEQEVYKEYHKIFQNIMKIKYREKLICFI